MDAELLKRIERVRANAGGPTDHGSEPATGGVTDVTLVTHAVSDEGYAVLDDVERWLETYVAYPSEYARLAHTLWIAHTHIIAAFNSTPRLAFLSPEPASGKTRALEATELLVPRPVEAVNVSPSYLFRKVGAAAGLPTILFDEIDTVFGPKSRDHEDLRGLLNAGHRKGAVAGRCVVRGNIVETVEYPAYCAVAMAGLGQLPDTILTRSVVIRMRRRAPHETVRPFRRRVAALEGHKLCDRLAAWAASVEDSIADAWPEMPDGVEDRDADVWEALLAVADAAGGHWPIRARTAAMALVAEVKESTPSLGVRLLADLRTVFSGRNKMHTIDILAELNGLEESQWAELIGGRPLNDRGLANRLAEYEIQSKLVRIGEKVARGYTQEDLADAWGRYLPPMVESTEPGATHASDERGASPRVQSVTSVTPVTGDGRVLSIGSSVGADNAALPADRPPREGRPGERRCVDCGIPLPGDHPGHYCEQHGREPDPGKRQDGSRSSSRVTNGSFALRDTDGAGVNGAVVEMARQIATLSSDELLELRAELADLPPNDPYAGHDLAALALFDSMTARELE